MDNEIGFNSPWVEHSFWIALHPGGLQAAGLRAITSKGLLEIMQTISFSRAPGRQIFVNRRIRLKRADRVTLTIR